jgi:hypothetical protein
VKIVNILPPSMSGETDQDRSPTIAVNPNNPGEIVISSLTSDEAANVRSFVSSDGGSSWALKSIASGNGSFTGGINMKYGQSGIELYSVALRGDAEGGLDILRTGNPAAGATTTLVASQPDSVQLPFLAAATATFGPDAGEDRVYIGINYLNTQVLLGEPTGRSALIFQSTDATDAVPVFISFVIDQRPKNLAALQDLTPPRDGPQIRPAVHQDGTVYAVFYSWKTWEANGFAGNGRITSDVVIVRDDNWAQSLYSYTALQDNADFQPGQRIATDVNLVSYGYMGQERIGNELAIAVDPANSSVVYVVWVELVNGGGGGQADVYLMHLRKSTDRGQTWSNDLLSVTNGKNPGLAINDKGQIAFLYQRYTGDPQSDPGADNPVGQRWETHLALSVDGSQWKDTLLATVPADSPPRTNYPYFGDYADIMAVGDTFYGVFCANNTPSLANFPMGVTYLRNHDFTTQTLFAEDGLTPVAVSIDPFFFSTAPVLSIQRPPLSDIAKVLFILFGVIQGGGGGTIDPAGHIHISGPDPGPVWGYLVNLAEYRTAMAGNDMAALEIQKLALQNIVDLARTQISKINGQLGADV